MFRQTIFKKFSRQLILESVHGDQVRSVQVYGWVACTEVKSDAPAPARLSAHVFLSSSPGLPCGNILHRYDFATPVDTMTICIS